MIRAPRQAAVRHRDSSRGESDDELTLRDRGSPARPLTGGGSDFDPLMDAIGDAASC